MKIIDCPQGSDDWHSARLGKVTGSNFAKVLNSGVGRKNYMKTLVRENISGEREQGFSSSAMRWGIDTEDEAREQYSHKTGHRVDQVGFVELNEFVGISPDGLIGKQGLVEIKCPNTNTHLKTLKSGKLPSQYRAQVQGQLWVSGRQWCDFVSYDPRLHEDGLWIHRVERDNRYIARLKQEVIAFVNQMIDVINELQPRIHWANNPSKAWVIPSVFEPLNAIHNQAFQLALEL